jgi:hypothetical protein
VLGAARGWLAPAPAEKFMAPGAKHAAKAPWLKNKGKRRGAQGSWLKNKGKRRATQGSWLKSKGERKNHSHSG